MSFPRLQYVVPFVVVIAASILLNGSDSFVNGTLVESTDFSLTQQNQTNEFIGGHIDQFFLGDGDGGHKTRRVVIPNCPDLSFQSLPWDKLGLDSNAKFLDFASPNSLDASYKVYEKPPCGHEGNPWGYGRHHIYPLSLVAQFVDFLSRFTEFYPGPDFCSWVKSDLLNDGVIHSVRSEPRPTLNHLIIQST
jgi:hypothetical protein